MARHMLLTALIVAGIYLGLLVVIEHPLVVAAEQTEMAAQAKSQGVVLPTEKAAETKGASAVKTTQFSMPDTTLVGVSGAIDLNNAQVDAAKLWQKFSHMKALQNNVDWSKGNIQVYAYYHNFNQDFTWADLMVGYDYQDLKLHTGARKMTIRQGSYQKYRFVVDKNTASDQAWAQAYVHKNLMERHQLNADGRLVSTDVIVITR